MFKKFEIYKYLENMKLTGRVIFPVWYIFAEIRINQFMTENY